MQGPLGKLLDILAVIATVTGVSATLGFGALQISEGLNFLFNIPANFTTQILIIIMATALFIWSTWSGLSKGIKMLSNINMILAFIVLVVVLSLGRRFTY